jgi:glycosyltransferase involved in cell wall biosynthesis
VSERPLFSVVLPTCNRVADLERALHAWERQAPADLPFELVAVDDGSTDGTGELLAGWRSRRFALRRAAQANAGPAAARNRAIGLAAGELVLFTGDDVEPTPGLLAEHWQGHRERDDPGAAILGLTRWPDRAPLTATMRHVDGVGAQQFSYRYMEEGGEYDFRHLYTSNVSLRRSLLDREPAGFNTDFPHAAFEDAELGWRLSRHGLRIVFRSRAVAFHHHAYDARSFYRRQVRCGEMAVVLWRQRPYLRRWLPVRDLEWARLGLLAAPARRRRLAARVATDLEAWEGRAVSLATQLDPVEGAPADPLLLALFRYALLRGAAGGLWGEAPARRVCGALFLDLLPPAVVRLARESEELGLALPEADLRALLALAGAGRPAAR